VVPAAAVALVVAVVVELEPQPAAAPKRALVPTMTTTLRSLEFMMSCSIGRSAGRELGCP
jgi:hypothetical protein